jgi:glutathione S-transferase
MLKLYGHYASQPTRSVAWLLKLKKTPFDFITINPVAGETRTPEFRSKFPLGLIPAIEDSDTTPPFTLSEASSIMIYLCEKYGWEDYYPTYSSDIQKRAKIHEYISHHNESARMMTRKVIMPTMKWMFANNGDTQRVAAPKHLSHNPDDIQNVKLIIRDIAKRFEHKFLHNPTGDYIVGETPTIADLLAYPELSQVPMIMGIDYNEWEELERLRRWLAKMEELPFHQDVHRTVYKIGKMYKSKL